MQIKSTSADSWVRSQRPSRRIQFKFWISRWSSVLIRLLEKLLIGSSLSSILVQDVSSLSRLKSAVEKVDEVELLEDAQVIPRTFAPGVEKFPVFGDSRRAIFRYVIKDAVIHLDSGLANVCGGFLIEELFGHHTGVFGGGTAVHEYRATMKSTKSLAGYWAVMPLPKYYFHFIAQTLPTLLRAVAHPKIQGVVVSTRTPKWAVEVLESLDLEIVFVSEQTIKIENYVCCSVPQISSKSDVNLMRESFSRYLTSEPKNLAFVGRGNRKRSLGLLEDDVARMIENHGGLLVDPEKLGWKHELEFFSGVDRFILTGGSASANVVWMRPGTKILALFPFGGFTTQIEKSQYEAAEVQYMEFNTDSLTRIDNLLEKRLLEFING
jgi:hypothetical protein